MKQIAHAAEAVIFLDKDRIIKKRVVKGYRLPVIDIMLRKIRTRREAKVISEIPVPAPKLYSSDDKKMEIEMEYIKGDRLSDVLEKKNYKKIGREMGRMLSEMHKKGIIHGDMTTSNMILAYGTKTKSKIKEKKEKNIQKKGAVYFIDFGLSFFSERDEDKAVDLHLLKQALVSRHHTIWQDCFKSVLSGYKDKAVIRRLLEVEKRGRNKVKI